MIKKAKNALLYTAVVLFIMSFLLVIMFSLGVDGVGKVKNVWNDFQYTAVALKYFVFLLFYIYFDNISGWVAKRKKNPELKALFISKKYMFFIPIIGMEVLRYA
jgi:hypothetical protein